MNGSLSAFSMSCCPDRHYWRPGLPVCYRPGRNQDAFRKIGCSAKRANRPVNRLFPAKSRTTTLGPFGEIIRATGPMAKVNPIRFSTEYCDDESDLLYYGYRYYKASTGDWLNRDPMEEDGGDNLYGFVRNNPISRVDNLGLITYFWTEATARAELTSEISDWTAQGYILAPPLLQWFLDKKGPAEYTWDRGPSIVGALEIRSDPEFQTEIRKYLRTKCPYYGQLKEAFNDDPSKEAFSARFWHGDLFYALFGAHFGLNGFLTCSCNGGGIFIGLIIQKDSFTFPSGAFHYRNLAPAYSAAHYLESIGYQKFTDVQLWFDVINF